MEKELSSRRGLSKFSGIPYSIALLVLILLLASCASNRRKSIPTEFQNKPITQVGVVNNPRYFGKQFSDDTPVEVVEVEGRSQIFASGEQAAFESALEHALRNAVEIVLGTMVDTRTLVNRGVLIDDKIYSRAYGYVKTYQVLTEKNQEDTKFLRVRAAVVIGDVRDDALAMGILQDRAQRPIIVVVVDEKDVNNKDSDFFKAALESRLLEKQFEIINQEQMKRVLKKVNADMEAIAADKGKFLEVGIESGAQIIVKAKVDAVVNDLSKNPLFKDRNLKSVNVSVWVEGYNVGDARLISVRQLRDNGVGLDVRIAQKNALDKMVKSLGDELINDLIKKWDLRINNGFEHTVMISGISSQEAAWIKNVLPKRLQGVKAVFDRGYAGQVLSLLIRFQGQSDELARGLLSKLTELKLKLRNYDPNKVLLYKE